MPINPESHQAAVMKLGHDLLFEIFYINAAEEAPKSDLLNNLALDLIPLTTIRRASQVCREWNKILLQSPSIWGRCVNLDALDQTNDHWRNLVLKRTGQSMLSVSGSSFMKEGSGVEMFLVSLVDEHWARIRNLGVTISFSSMNATEIWAALSRPSGSLETLVICTDYDFSSDLWAFNSPIPSSFPSESTFQLLSHHAPSLTHLSISTTFIPVDLTGIHSSNMRHLHLPNHSLELTDIELLTICLQMPLLETLVIRVDKLIVRPPSELSSLQPPMPRLSKISIFCQGLDIYSAFLDRIVPSPVCRLDIKHNIFTWDAPDIETSVRQGTEHMRHITECYLHSFFTNQTEQSNIVDAYLHLLSESKLGFGCCHRLVSINVEIHHGSIDLRRIFFERVFDTFTTLKLPSPITQLNILMSPDLMRAFPGLVRAGLKSMHSVTNLTTTSSGNPSLSNMYK